MLFKCVYYNRHISNI